MAVIGGAIAGALFTEGTIAYAVTAGIVDLGLSVGLSYVAKALMGNQQQATTTGNSGKLSSGGAVPRTFMVGVGQTAGSLIYAGTWGDSGKTPNAYMTFVIALSDYPITSLEELWIDSVKVTVPDFSDPPQSSSGWSVPEYENDGDHNLWIKFYDGTQSEADAFLVEKFGSHPTRPWKSTSVGHGIAYAVVTCEWNDKFFSGYPKFNFVLKGIKTYDIRKDGTAGGSGAQRWADTTTWTWSDNAAAVAYTVVRGLSFGGKWFYGLQNPDKSRLPYPEWALAANVSDVAITNNDGSTERQYRVGGEVPVGTKLSDTIQSLLTACNGRLSEVGGIYKLRIGAAGDPIGSFSDDDILSTEDQTASPLIALADKINGITAKYPEPNQIWAQFDAPPLYNATFEAADGNRRLLTNVNYDLVPYQRQVQRLMQSALNEHRRARKHTVMFAPWARALEPGDVLRWTSARWGYDAKLVRADQLSLQPNGDVQVQFTEVDPSDYDWNPSTDEKTPNYGSLTLEPPAPQQIVGWQVEPATFYDADEKARRPSIAVLYAGGLVDVDYIHVVVRLAASQAIVFDGTIPYDAPDDQQYSTVLNGVFLPNTDYEVRGIYVSRSNRDFDWSAWLAVTTPNVLLGPDDIYLPGVVDEVNKSVSELTEWAVYNTRETIEDAWDIANLTVDQDAGNYRDKQELRESLTSVYQQTKAEYQLAITVATGPDSALAQRIEDLEVEVNDNVASAVSLLQTQISNVDGEVTAVSQSITSLTSTVGEVTASGQFRVYTDAAPSGSDGRVAISVSASAGADPVTASIFLDALSDGTSQVTINAARFAVTDGSGNDQHPFIFQSGEAQLNVARIGTVKAGILQDVNGNKMVIDLGAGSISIFT